MGSVLQASALGGPAVLSFLSRGVLVVAVEDNATAMRVGPEDMDPSPQRGLNIVAVRSYAEAAGVVAAHKAGVLLESLSSLVSPVTVTRLRNPSL